MEKDIISLQKSHFSKAEEILLSFPPSGLYEGESPSFWLPFLKSVDDVYKKEEGPRSDIQKEISKTMKEQKDNLNPSLNLIGCNVDDPILKIYQKFNLFSPGEQYIQYCKVKKGVMSSQTEINDLSNKDSYFYKKISSGMSGKHADSSFVDKKIDELMKIKMKKLETLQNQVNPLELQLLNDKKYQEWFQLSNLMQPFFEKWLNVDSQIGKDSNKRGLLFEEKCQKDLIPILEEKLKTKDFVIHNNIGWLGTQGEIDMVITNLSCDNVIALAECKARLFDIAYGYYQSGPEGRMQKGKKKVKINDKILEIDAKTPCFVISLIQENPYNLGFESKLKEALDKYLLDYTRSWKPEEMFQELKEKFGKKMSPLDWFYKYSQNFLIFL